MSKKTAYNKDHRTAFAKIRLTEEEKEVLKEYAHERRRSLTSLIRERIEDIFAVKSPGT